ncbi:MAG TPA: oligosaccharide flippase family protein [Pyrinomonadaceae bacterium]|jgi:O-antigen/teichoic acid export membrane protein
MIFRSLNFKASLKLNLFSNLFGSLWTAALGILFVPIYLRYVGIESYGIIGFFTSLQTFFYILDFGLSPTFNREVAQFSALNSAEAGKKIVTLTKTLQRVNWLISVALTVILLLLSPLLASYWIRPETLSVTTVTQCLIIMSIAFGLQFPMSLYSGGLLGLQQQVTLNIITIIFGTLRSFGAFLMLAYISPTIQAFLIWQAVIALLQTCATATAFYKKLPYRDPDSKFEFGLLKRIWRFAAGNTGISVVGLILAQSDKIILSKLISLEEFGYYSLTTTVASLILMMLASSVQKVSYPQFSALTAAGDEANLIYAYHKNSQLVSVLTIPTTLVFVFFSKEILFLWTRNETIAEKAWILMTLYSIGMGINCLMWIPNGMQLAHGWTKLTFMKDLVGVFIFIPLLIFLVLHYGAVGGATGWIILNSVGFVAYTYFMHRRILRNELANWYIWDIGSPFVSVLAVVTAAKLIAGENHSLGSAFILLAIVSICAFTAAGLSSYMVRDFIFGYVNKFFVLTRRTS